MIVIIFLFCVSCRDPGLMERVTVRILPTSPSSELSHFRTLTVLPHLLQIDERTRKLGKGAGFGMSKLPVLDRKSVV